MKYELQDCIGARLSGLSRRIDNIYRKHLKDTGITQSQLSIMLVLYKSGEVEQHKICDALYLETSSLSRMLVRLINQNLVLKNGPINRPTIALTPSGVSKVGEVLPLWEKAMDEAHHLLGKDAMTALGTFEDGFN